MDFTLDHFTAIAERAISEIEYPSRVPGLYKPIKYTMASGGKRLRPALCLAAYSALTHREPDAITAQATAIELFHNFTLLHDDVMDNAELRRGQPTVHCRWDRNTAILSGDAMLTMAYTKLVENAPACLDRLLELFNTTTMEVYQGQQLDMEFENRTNVGVDEYLEMIRLKTSVLIACATKTGAILSGCDENTAKLFYDYGVALGMAFQLRDDWLDTFGDPAVFGKEIGGDISNNKKTWLLITALEEAKAEISPLLEYTVARAEKIRRITAVYNSLDLAARCNDLARKYSGDAVAAIRNIGLEGSVSDMFVNLALYAVNRDH